MNSNLPKSTSSTTGSDDPRVGKYDIIATRKLRPHPDNPRKHPRAQIQAIANSILVFGLNAPLIIDRHNQIRAGHGRYEAAKLLGIKELPVVYLEHLSD